MATTKSTDYSIKNYRKHCKNRHNDNNNDEDVWLTARQRKWDAKRQAAMRRSTAEYQENQLIAGPRPINGDEKNIPHFIAMYSKTLPHDNQGRVDSKAYRKMVAGLIQRRI